ncbi:MAG: sugar transferase [Blastocatellia bacterium]
MTTKANAGAAKSKTLPRSNGKLIRGFPLPDRDPSDLTQLILSEDLFLGMLCLERKRAERSSKKFLLLLIDAEETHGTARHPAIVKGIVSAANITRREIDLAGWYKHSTILGILFIELGRGARDDSATIQRLVDKVQESLRAQLSPEDLRHVHVSGHVFAGDASSQDPDLPSNTAFYPDLFHREDSKKLPLLVKRSMDMAGSAAALALCSPLLLLIAAVVKLTSRGPVFFRQERLGQFGKSFTCLKFRSMHAGNDLKVHQDFMKRVISGEYDGHAGNGSKPVYKMKNDPRVTRIGRVLRRTSLDELPQFINVLRGEMSLVGPRPPLAYEYEEYDVWHRRRVLEIKPGITGLWQVKGRSRVRFDDMVRLDLQYARQWSLWLDIQILLKTPGAVVLGDGAY